MRLVGRRLYRANSAEKPNKNESHETHERDSSPCLVPWHASTLCEAARNAALRVHGKYKKPQPKRDQNSKERPKTNGPFVARQFFAVRANNHFHVLYLALETIILRPLMA